MALSQANLSTTLQWALSKSNTGYGNTTEGPDSVDFSLTGISLTTYNQIVTLRLSLAASASSTIDLTAQTNLVQESVNFTKVLSIIVLPVGSQVTVTPGASNPLQWFFGGTTQSVIIPAGGLFAFSGPASSSGTTVNSSNKTLKFTNSGATALTCSVVILGGT